MPTDAEYEQTAKDLDALAARVRGWKGTTPPVPPDPPPVRSHSQVGATWTANRPAMPAMASTLAVLPMQMQHIVDHGAGNPWPSAGVGPLWAQLDPMLDNVRAAGAVQRVLCANKAPRWITVNPAYDDQRPTDAHFATFGQMAAQAAAHAPDFGWLSVWNEYKGFWSNAANRPDYDLYLRFYNAVREPVKQVRPDIRIGGPYPTIISCSYQRGESTLQPSFPGGYFDARWLAAMKHFVQNADYDFLTFDMGIENAVGNFGGQYFGAPPDQQVQKFASFIAWVRGLGGRAATCPIVCCETYVHVAALAPYNYSDAALEDLFLAMAAQTAAASPGGPLYWLTWMSPEFWPEVVNRATPTAWANTASGFGPKVARFHSTGA